ncbi:MAG: hypothetical protein CMH91_03675 [Oceanicaulis sp.]|uniref:hypothetical protein n=1 Tax=unclassified Oceanicaulis TaxID=2632123 RepID=UPI000C5D2202|nr:MULTISPECIES: hypothetical protein [unclassified Oceanicaulis]MAB69421.1 hypothetical protein [Oceanicaulis sp.]MBC38150.1 hypothetical protein [Oceanicaulis sp.]HBU60960.1 hypothetical protein [Oceanicaulis sp.]
MSDADNLARLEALYEAFREGRPRPEKVACWLSAACLLMREDDPDALVAQVRDRQAALKSELGWRSPTGALRWLYAAMMTQNDIPVERFLAARAALQDHVGWFERASLHAGGARAALMLCVGSSEDTPIERFLAMREALQPPWWRASASVTDTYAAIHAARGDDPAEVLALREAAEAVFRANPRSRGHTRDGGKMCALLKADPHEAMARFEALDAARQTHKALRRHAFRQRFVQWAIQGLGVDDALAIETLRQAVPNSVTSMGGERTALAHLVHTAGRSGLQDGALSAMDAVIAAQTAVMVSVITASSVAVTASSSSSGSGS